MKTTIACEVVLTDADSNILLLRRTQDAKRRAGQWDVPGGHLDSGESLEEAASRELEEEAGISVAVSGLRLVYTKTAIRDDLNVAWLFFAAKSEAPADSVRLSNEHDEYRWTSVDEAIDMLEYPLQKDALIYIRDHDLL